MKPLAIYACVISLSSLAAAVQPSEEPAELHAALAMSELEPSARCDSADCKSGWQSASDHAIYDISDCRQMSDKQGEIEGCKAFVNQMLQERLENQW